MSYNLNSGYGALLAHVLPLGVAGKVFVVGASGVAHRDMYTELFDPDGEGVVRFADSIAGALTGCVDNGSDVILVLPGHTETVSSAAALDLDVAGVSVIGLGVGNNRPTITLDTATTAYISVSADNVRIENVIIDGTGFDAIAKVLNISGDGVTVRKCKFILADSGAQAVLGLVTASASNMLIEDNIFEGTSNAGTTSAIELVGGDDVVVRNNILQGAYAAADGAIYNITTAVTNLMIIGNIINNLTASSTKAIVLASGSTGVISGNKMQILSGTAPITGAAMSWAGDNYYAAAIATAGALL